MSQYLSQVYAITTGTWGNAIDYQAGGSGGGHLAANGFSWSTDRNFADGDILVWGTGIGSSAGHVAVWYHGQMYDQNFGGRRTAGLDNFISAGFLGHWRKGALSGDGGFVRVNESGAVFRMAGGAPIYVSSWNAVGGSQPVTNISQAQLDAMPAYPRDGTFLAASSGTVYRVAGGAPEAVSTWNSFGGPQPNIPVDQAAIDNAGGGAPWNHLRAVPADGTFISNTADGRVYRVAGGAPLYVSTWNVFGGSQPTTSLDPWEFIHFAHLRATPDNVFIRGASTGSIFRVVDGGHPYYVPSWAPYGGSQPYVDVDDYAINGCDHLACGPFGGLEAVTAGHGNVTVSGWTIDPNATTTPTRVHVYVGGPAGSATGEGHDAGTANLTRTDVANAYPGTGSAHGYNLTVPTNKLGTQPVYVYAINTPGTPGDNPLLGVVTTSVAAPVASRCDFTGDRKADIIARDSTGHLYLYPGTGTGSFASRRLMGSGWGGFTSIFCSSDFNSDGKADVLGRTSTGNLMLYPGSGTGALGAGRVVGTGWSGFTSILSAGDMTGDRKADILGRTSTGNLVLFPGAGNGTLGAGRVIGKGWSGFTAVFSPGDFTGDGKSDVMTRTSAGALMLYPGNGAGALGVGRQIGTGWSGFTRVFSPGDLTGDGKADVLARTGAGALKLYPGTGTGALGTGRQVGTGWNIYNVLAGGS
ncbi:VCBS repeat-containing protein [Pedococcus sp. KACC 23699]|uniref:VCBS repeat-containing protein n=1 Tax=Pedococcus sp. KACC 23699 TaxID=3149228 RepID=A0AAU7JYN1_9MICO